MVRSEKVTYRFFTLGIYKRISYRYRYRSVNLQIQNYLKLQIPIHIALRSCLWSLGPNREVTNTVTDLKLFGIN